MSKAKYFETDNGKQLKTAQFDGYNINDRAFEDLMFQVDINEDGTLNVYLKDEDKDFFSDFNESKWLKTALDYAYRCDTYSDPNTGDECWLVLDEPVATKTATPIVINKTPISAITTKANINHVDSMKDSIQEMAKNLGLGKVNFGPNGISIEDAEKDTEVEIKETPVVGEFKTKRKYLSFLSAVAGKRIRLTRETAFIKGESLSGTLEGTKFKITICSEGTINFEEVGTNLSDTAMRKRLLDDIDSIEVSGYAQKFIVSELEFEDQDGYKCFLEVEHVKPYDRLMSILEDKEEIEVEEKVELSNKGLDFLDSLLAETTEEVVEEKSTALTYIEEQFRKMNEDKINELKDRIDKKESDIKKFNIDAKQAEKNVEKSQEELSILETRLETLFPNLDLNGYVFLVSDEQKSEFSLSDSDTELVSRIADLLKLKKDVLIKHLTESFYKISIAKKDNFEDKKVTRDIYQTLQSIDLLSKLTVISDGEFEYRGKLNWHQLTAKMLKKGFEQDPEFDKLSGSNSYDVKTDREILTDQSTSEVVDVVEKVKTGFNQKTLMTFTKPETLVILGDGLNDCDDYDFQVTDDESCFDIYVDGKEVHSCNCTGFGSIVTLAQYKNWLNDVEYKDISGAYIVPGFVGTIGISAKLEDGSFSTKFDLNDYIAHQFNDQEEYADVVINFPEGTEVKYIKNHDLNSVTALLRDDKINSVLSDEVEVESDRTTFIGNKGGWLKNSDKNKHIFNKLNFVGKIYEPKRGDAGEKICEVVTSSGKTYIRVKFPEGESIINKDKLR